MADDLRRYFEGESIQAKRSDIIKVAGFRKAILTSPVFWIIFILVYLVCCAQKAYTGPQTHETENEKMQEVRYAD